MKLGAEDAGMEDDSGEEAGVEPVGSAGGQGPRRVLTSRKQVGGLLFNKRTRARKKIEQGLYTLHQVHRAARRLRKGAARTRGYCVDSGAAAGG